MFGGERIKALEEENFSLMEKYQKLERFYNQSVKAVSELERQNRDLIWILEEIGVQIEVQENLHRMMHQIPGYPNHEDFEYRLHLNKIITESDTLNKIKFHIAKAMLDQQKENSQE